MTSSNRLEFADRDLLSGEFSRGRDVGVQALGPAGQGEGGIPRRHLQRQPRRPARQRQRQIRIRRPPDVPALRRRAVFESDFESRAARSRCWPWPASSSATTSTGRPTWTTSTRASWVWTPSSSYRGLFLFAEYFARHRTPETSAAFDSNGFHAQAGYFLIRDRLEIAARWAGYDPSDLIADNDRTEVRGVVNYYLNKHSLKFQGDFRQIDDDGRGTKNRRLRLQAQVVF